MIIVFIEVMRAEKK